MAEAVEKSVLADFRCPLLAIADICFPPQRDAWADWEISGVLPFSVHAVMPV